MKRKMLQYMTLALVLAACGSIPAFSQVSFTIFGGFNNPGELTVQNVRSGLEGDAVVGFRFETDFGRVIGFEHTLGFMPDFAAADMFANPDDQEMGFIYNSNLILNVPVKKFVPYVTAGLGLVHSGRIFSISMPGSSGADNKFGTRFALNYGGGLKFTNLVGPMGVRFDVRGYSLPEVLDESLHMFEITGGLMFSF